MSDHDEAVLRLASTAFDDDGWMSDAQDAQLEWDGNGQTLHFCGEGSIDVGHAVSIALADRGKPQVTDEMVERAAIRVFADSWSDRPSVDKARSRWDRDREYYMATYGARARAYLEAALGGEA